MAFHGALRFKGYENKVLVDEDMAEMEYQPRNALGPIGSSSCARTSVCKRASRSSSMKSVTFFTSPTASITQASKSSVWPTGAAIRRT